MAKYNKGSKHPDGFYKCRQSIVLDRERKEKNLPLMWWQWQHLCSLPVPSQYFVELVSISRIDNHSRDWSL